MGWLERADRRNQYASNWLIDNPEAGTQSFPLAKSPRARMLLGGLLAATVIATLIFGIVGGLAGVVIASLLGRRLQHDPMKQRYQRRGFEADSTESDGLS